MKENPAVHTAPIDEYWDFPGGRVQEGETVLETPQREIEEETGIHKIIEPEFVTAVISNHEIPLKNGEIVGLVLMVYKVSIGPHETIRLSDEHLGWEWVAPKEAARRLTHKYPKEFTEKVR